jgi:hypothetical protein
LLSITRKKILKDKINQGELNYLPGDDLPMRRQLRSNEGEGEGEGEEREDEEGEGEREDERLREGSIGSTASIIQTRHKVKTFADIGYECFGSLGF